MAKNPLPRTSQEPSDFGCFVSRPATEPEERDEEDIPF